LIDLPVFEDTIFLNKVRVLYCPNCGVWEIPKESIRNLMDRLKSFGLRVSLATFENVLNKSLEAYRKNWTERTDQRKVMSIYFPTKEGLPAKAQVSVSVSERLYPTLRSLTSEDVRRLLGIEHYEDLERAAKAQARSISQYIKHEIARRILVEEPDAGPGTAGGEHALKIIRRKSARKRRSGTRQILTLRPQRINVESLVKETEASYKPVTDSDEAESAIHFASEGDKVVGRLSYDHRTGNLVLAVTKDRVGLRVFDLEILLKDGRICAHGAKVEKGRILLKLDRKISAEGVKEIRMRMI
jgi:hypothetical protein